MKSRLTLLVFIACVIVAAGVQVSCGATQAADPQGGADVHAAEAAAEPWAGEAPYAPTLFPVRQDGKWGFIDAAGQLVIDFRYDDVRDFSDGLAAVKVGEWWGYIDESGSFAINPTGSVDGSPFCEGLAQVVTDTGVGYIDNTGSMVITPEFEAAYEFHEGLAGVSSGGEYGYIDPSGEIVIRLPMATAIGEFGEGLAAVRYGRYGYIDRTGEFVIERGFVDASEFSNGLAVVEYASFKYQLVDKNGHVVRTLDYDQVMDLREGRAAVLTGGIVAALESGADLASAEGHWGFMDDAGKLVVPCQFALVQDFRGGLARVENEDGKMAYIDLDGKYVWREK